MSVGVAGSLQSPRRLRRGLFPYSHFLSVLFVGSAALGDNHGMHIHFAQLIFRSCTVVSTPHFIPDLIYHLCFFQVTAQDKASGKVQTITITSDKGRLSEEEISRMISVRLECQSLALYTLCLLTFHFCYCDDSTFQITILGSGGKCGSRQESS